MRISLSPMQWAGRLLPAVVLAGCATHVDLREIPVTAAPPVPPAAPVPAPLPPAPAPVEVFAVRPPGDGVAVQPGATALPEQTARLQSWVADHRRVYTAAAPLMIRNAPLCKTNARRILGFTAKNRYSYTQQYAAAAESAFGLDDRLRVMLVLPGSGAEAAGLTSGDVLLAFNDKPAPEGAEAEREAASLLGSETRGRTQIALNVLRGTTPVTLTVPLTEACAFGVELGDLAEPVALADGYRVLVSRPMLQFVRSDAELSYAIAHAFAHNLATTSPLPRTSEAIDRARFLRDAPQPLDPAELPTYGARDEARADELALYMLARAGVPLDGYAEFWDRLEAAAPAANPHGTIEQRRRLIGIVTRTIARKQAGGLPLEP